MVLNPMQQGISTLPTTSTIQSFAEVRMLANGRRSHMTHASYGLTHSPLQLTDIFMSQPTSSHRQARFHKGQDLRRKPYTLFRIRIDAQPVLLRR